MLHKMTFSNSVISKLTGPFCQPSDVGYSLNQSPPALIGVKKESTGKNVKSNFPYFVPI